MLLNQFGITRTARKPQPILIKTSSLSAIMLCLNSGSHLLDVKRLFTQSG